MKKRLLISILALAAALTSCVKVEYDMPAAAPSYSINDLSDQKIGFNTVLYSQQTKAAGTTPLPDGSSFRTFGFYTGAYNWGDLNSSTMVSYIWYEEVSKIDGEWHTENDYYWPKSGKLSFISYAPADAGLGIQISGDLPNLFAPDYENNGTDLLIAFSENKTLSNSQNGVDVSFRHALSQVNLQFKAKTLEANGLKFDITVTEVSISNVCQIAALKWSGGTQEISWTNPDSPQAVSFRPSTGVTLDPNSFKSLGGQIIIPQQISGISLNVKFTLVTKNSSGTTLDSTDITCGDIPLNTNDITAWEVNHNYTYNIIINPLSDQTITFEATVGDWNTTSSETSMNE